jgi:hypothetical protein
MKVYNETITNFDAVADIETRCEIMTDYNMQQLLIDSNQYNQFLLVMSDTATNEARLWCFAIDHDELFTLLPEILDMSLYFIGVRSIPPTPSSSENTRYDLTKILKAINSDDNSLRTLDEYFLSSKNYGWLKCIALDNNRKNAVADFEKRQPLPLALHDKAYMQLSKLGIAGLKKKCIVTMINDKSVEHTKTVYYNDIVRTIKKTNQTFKSNTYELKRIEDLETKKIFEF